LTGLLGDVNGDDVVNIIDAQQIARFSVGLPVTDPERVLSHGDVNEDGVINIIDAQQVARYSVGLPTPNAPNIGEPVGGECVGEFSVLHWTDQNLGTSAVPGAIVLAGVTATEAADATDFVSLLQQGGWDLVIFGEQNTNTFSGAVQTELSAYVTGGGKLLATTWLSSPLAGFLEAMVTGVNYMQVLTDGHPIFAGLPATIMLTDPGWGVHAQAYLPTGAAECIGSTSIGDCAAILGHGGHTLLLGPLFDTYATLAEGERLVAQSMLFLIYQPSHVSPVAAGRTAGDAAQTQRASEPAGVAPGERVQNAEKRSGIR
jgi:hypothetical protein